MAIHQGIAAAISVADRIRKTFEAEENSGLMPVEPREELKIHKQEKLPYVKYKEARVRAKKATKKAAKKPFGPEE